MLISGVYAAAPILGSMTISDPISLTAGSTNVISCNTTLSDADGWANVTTTNGTFWHSTSTEAAADDANDHYTNSSCSVGANSSLTDAPITCQISLEYYSNPGNWTCKIRGRDGATEGTNETNVTVNSLVAISIPTAMDFRDLALGAISTNSTENVTSVENTGNVLLDVDLSGDALSCTTGTIPVGNIKYSDTDDTAYASMTALSGSATTLDLNIAQRTGAASTDSIYWKLQVPSTGIGGTCTNTVTFTASAS